MCSLQKGEDMTQHMDRVGHVHFDVQGEWFTWMLRHQWVEGSEHSALRMWMDAFPDHSDLETIKNGTFIKIVSGELGFTGYASGENGLELIEENRKCWDPDQSGEDNDSFPLLDSWEDTLRLKKAKLFILEMETLISRTFGNADLTFSHETEYMEEYTNYSDIMKLLQRSMADLFDEQQSKVARALIKGLGRYGAEDSITDWIDSEEGYFFNKYGAKLFRVDTETIDYLIGALEVEKRKGIAVDSYDEDWDTQHPEMEEEMVSATYGSTSILDKYLDAVKDTAAKGEFEPEDLTTSTYENGYIDKKGNFYGCGFIQHLNIDDDLVEQFKLETDRIEDNVDAQRIIELNRWVKISQERFFWDTEIHLLTVKQQRSISKLLQLWGRNGAEFSGGKFGQRETVEEAVKRTTEAHNFYKRIK